MTLSESTGLILIHSYTTGLIHIELTETGVAHTGSAQVWTRYNPRVETSVCAYVPSLTQKQSPTDNHVQMKIYFYPGESHWGNKPLLRIDCLTSSRQPTEDKLKSIFGGSLSHTKCHVRAFPYIYDILSFLLYRFSVYTV